MIIHGLINPHVASLLCRVRHTNTLVIADAAFPSWPGLETIDLALARGIPTIIQVLDVLLPIWKCGEVLMAEEFKAHNTAEHQQAFTHACRGTPLHFESHAQLKQRVPNATGLIRTGDTTQYGNMILTSA